MIETDGMEAESTAMVEKKTELGGARAGERRKSIRLAALLLAGMLAAPPSLADGASATRTPEGGRLIRSGGKSSQRSVDGIPVDPQRQAQTPPMIERTDGTRHYSGGARGPLVVGHVGCAGCQAYASWSTWAPWLAIGWLGHGPRPTPIPYRPH